MNAGATMSLVSTLAKKAQAKTPVPQWLINRLQVCHTSTLSLDIGLLCVRVFMLRIERSTNGRVVFTLSGRMQTEDIEQVQQLLDVEAPGQRLMFNLGDVMLVNQDAVTFLARCEANGIKLENCPLHIRNWIDQEKRRRRGPHVPD
jgi:hypothetical protein